MNIYLETLKKEILPNNKRSDFLIRILEKRLKDPAKENINKHHIIPKSWGGPNNKENFVKLTESEHFKVHQLLYEVTIDKEKKSNMQSAYWFMSHQGGYKIKNHKEYEKFKEEYKESNSGENSFLYNNNCYKIWTEKYGELEANKKEKERNLKHSISVSGENNPMYDKIVFDVWLEKYGKEEADRRYKEMTKKQQKRMKDSTSYIYEDGTVKVLNKNHPDVKSGLAIHIAVGEKNGMYGSDLYTLMIRKHGKDKGEIKYNEMIKKQKEKNSGKNNAMYGRKPYDIWLEKYGKEEADRRFSEWKQKLKKK